MLLPVEQPGDNDVDCEVKTPPAPEIFLPEISSRIYSDQPRLTLPLCVKVDGKVRQRDFRVRKGLNVLVFVERDLQGRRAPLQIHLLEVGGWEEDPMALGHRRITFTAGACSFSFHVPRRLERDLIVLRLISEFLFGDWSHSPSERSLPSYGRLRAVRRCLQEAAA